MCHQFTERSSILGSTYNPPIILNENVEYEIALVSFISNNTIPNIDQSNNKFHYADQVIEIPEGSYEISDIAQYLSENISSLEEDSTQADKTVLILDVIRSTMKSVIKCNKVIDFSKPGSIGALLGFKPRVLLANLRHESDSQINIIKLNCINIECNIVTNSFDNGKPVHILHMFYPTVPPGFRIVENPKPNYLPVNTKYINEIILKIVDQDGKLVNFKDELITIRLHMRERQ